MASVKDTATFFAEGSAAQFEHVLELYEQALRLKADAKAKKPEELLKLDRWYQNELPKIIKSRGKDAHMVHEELVQCMKWKQTRGKFYPQLSYLVKVNTPRAVMAETKKAFKKLPNLEQALAALSNLKGVGTTMASALLAAAAPDSAPFMADECLMAIPELEGIDYTAKEYINFVQHINKTTERLNKQIQNGDKPWSPHRVELALWTHYIVRENKPELLDNIPSLTKENGKAHTTNGEATHGELPSDDSNLEPPVIGIPTTVIPFSNGKEHSDSLPGDENSTTTSFNEDSLDKPATPITANSILIDQARQIVDDSTNDSIPSNEDSCFNTLPQRPTEVIVDDNAVVQNEILEPERNKVTPELLTSTVEDLEEDSSQEPPTKKPKN